MYTTMISVLQECRWTNDSVEERRYFYLLRYD